MDNKTATTPAFLNDGGEMGRRMREKNWLDSAVGTPDVWPQNLRTAINLLLHSKFPMFVWWGKELTCFYNDPYLKIAGEKHPLLLGSPGNVMWAEIWNDLAPLVDSVFAGRSTWSEDQLLLINRHGQTEETYFTFSYSPILNDEGNVDGLFCACIETTEKVLASRTIAEREKNLRNTILQSPVAMCILRKPDFSLEIANQRMYELWGRGEDELMGKPIFDGLPEAKSQGLQEILTNVFVTGESYSASEQPMPLPRADGVQTIYLNFVYAPIKEGDGSVSGIIAVAIDVTPQVLGRKAIEESELRLQQRVKERTEALVKQKQLVDNILDNSSNGISVTEMIRDSNGNIYDAKTIIANDGAVRNTGLDREVYLSKTAREIEPQIFETEYGKECLKTLETGIPMVMQFFLAATGRWLELTVSKMDDNHLIHIFTDVTSIKQTQIELEKKVEELKHSNANLEQFAYAASHDLKEPIRKISIFSDRLKDELSDQLSAQQLRLFDRMENATKRMNTLIEDLLHYSYSTKGLLNVEAIDLNAKVRTVLDDLEIEVQEKKATFSIEPLPVIMGNRRQIQQLFQNLFVNALKYSKVGEPPYITLSCKQIKGTATPLKLAGIEGDQWYHQFELKDNGIGFEQQYAEDIFNIFTRLHGVSEYSGSGVGLSLVRRVVENHRGYIWASSEPGVGTTFTFLLAVN